MAVKQVTRRPNVVERMLTEYVMLGQESNTLSTRRSGVKTRLMEHIETNHEVDEEKGHLVHNLAAPVSIGGTQYTGFMKQRKVTQSFNEDLAETLCESKGIDIDDYTSRHVDQDKIVRLYAEGIITDDEFATLVSENENWAFVAVKA
jgi:regulator of replication initiation timing